MANDEIKKGDEKVGETYSACIATLYTLEAKNRLFFFRTVVEELGY